MIRAHILDLAMQVLRAQLSDVPRIAALVGRYWEFENLSGFDQHRVEKHIASLLALPEHGACWIAERSGVVAGYIIAVYVFSLEHGGVMAEIDEFFVSPEFRSAGTGKTLLLRCEDDMRSMGIGEVQLQIGVTNIHARNFYERHGYALRSGYALLEKPLSPA